MQHPILSIIGAGGKTTALLALARALAGQRVLLTTSTHIYPVAPPQSRALLIDPEADALLDALRIPGIVCAGSDASAGKLGALAPDLFRRAVQAADITLCEADGAHHLPLKLHRADEPVVPLDSARCVVVAGLSAWGRPVGEAVHRFALHPDWVRDSARLVAEDATLMAAVQTFYNANASFNMPSVIQIANDDFADNAENWINDGLSGNAAWKFGTIETGTATGSVRAMYYNRGNVASDIKWLYQDVPVTGIGAYDFWATLAVHNSRWNSLEENTNTYLYLNNDSINVITMGANDSKNQVLGSWDIFHVVSNVTSLDARENGPDAGHVRIGLEKRSDIDGLQLNMIYFAAPKLYYYGDWDKYLQGIYDVETVDTTYDVYSINGMKVRSNASSLDGLPRGIYIVNGKKYVVK